MKLSLFSLLGFAASLASGSEDVVSNLEKRDYPQGPYNIIFIFTDDQDHLMNSLDYMGGVQQHLIQQGITFKHHYCTVALCCPSRVNLLSGRAAHNTNVTGLAPPYGGWEKFVEQGLNDDWLPVWMQEAGYNTYYVGKLMNSFTEKNYNDPYPKGFNSSDFLVGKGTYNYYRPMYQRNVGDNHEQPKRYNMQYTVDLTLQKGLAFMDDARAANDGRPFFLTMAPVAPHAGGGPRPNSDTNFGPVPASKYAQAFPNEVVAREANFNPDQPSGSSWLLSIAQLNQSQVDENDEYFRQRIRTLQSVDELVNGTFAYLEEHNLTDNTFVIYSTDNGFHISQHRLFPGKNCPYEEDINIPLIIRGPNLKQGGVVNTVTTHTDMAATILDMAGAPPRDYLDGYSVRHAAEQGAQNFEHAQIEHWGDAGADEDVFYPDAPGTINTTYKALRIIGPNYSFYYSVWCSNQHELYDMLKDPGQLNNLYQPFTFQPTEPQDIANPFPLNRLSSRLDALLLVLKGCKGVECMRPWEALHPGGQITDLVSAMSADFDSFYQQKQNRISFSSCEQGYMPHLEGPQTFQTYEITRSRYARSLD